MHAIRIQRYSIVKCKLHGVFDCAMAFWMCPVKDVYSGKYQMAWVALMDSGYAGEFIL